MLARIVEQGAQLAADRIAGRGELGEPRELAVVEKFVGGKERVAKTGAFVREALAAAERDIDERIEPARFGPVEIAALGIDLLIDGGRDRGGRPSLECRAGIERDRERPAPRFERFGQRQRAVPRGHRRAIVAATLMQLTLAHPRHEVELVDRQGGVERRELGTVIARRAVGGGEVAAQRTRLGIRRRRLLKRRHGCRCISLLQCGHSPTVGCYGPWILVGHDPLLASGQSKRQAGPMVPRAVSQILADAAWLAHRYDPDHDAFHYRHVTRARHATVPFATDDCLGVEPAPVIIARKDAAQIGTSSTPLHFVFHSGYCASTMLVRALDVAGSAMGLSEPVVLNDMVGWRRRGADARLHGAVMKDALAQLARPFAPGEAVVVKPSNIFSGLAAGAMALRPDARALLLHAPLPEFLLSVARKGMWCRLWARELLDGLLQDGLVDLGFDPHDYFRQSDLQVAAVGWLAQQALFARIARQAGPTRVASLDSETLTRAPAATVAKVARHFGLPGNADAYGDHPAILRNSKSGEQFSPGERQGDQDRARDAYGEEIDMVVTWARAVADNAGVAMSLPNPLS